MNPFAAKESGMSSLMQSILPPDVLEAIRVAKEQLPNVIEHVQASVRRIEHKLETIDVNVQMVMKQVAMIDPNYVPANELLPANVVDPVLPNQFIDNGDIETVRAMNGKDANAG